MKRRAFRVILSLCVVIGLAVAPAGPAHAAIDPAASEAQFLTLMNSERVGAGLAPMNLDAAMYPMAIQWSQQMAAAGGLSHRPDLAARASAIVPTWSKLGENVGTGGSVTSLHQAFMNSPGHRANVLGDYNRVAIAVVVDGARIWVTFDFMKGPAINGSTGLDPPLPTISFAQAGNFWVTTANGKVYGVGTAKLFGDMSTRMLAQPIVGMAASPTGNGYWLVASDGGIFAFGDALFYGSTGAMTLNQPIVAMAPTSTGKGYWLVATDGGIFAFGDARFLGSMGGTKLNQPVNGMAATPTGKGYWMVASDGGIFAFGDAGFYGSAASGALPSPVTAIATLPSGAGYWLQSSAGAVYPFGAAASYGAASASGATLTKMATMPDGLGYRMASADGRIFCFGSGGAGVTPPLGVTSAVVAIANVP
jgi:hypothetical protein